MKSSGKTTGTALILGAFIFGVSLLSVRAEEGDRSPFGTDSATESASFSSPFSFSSPLFFSSPAPPSPVFSEIVRGNFGDLKIAPFQFRCVGTVFGEWGDFAHESQGAIGLNRGFKTGVWGGTLGADRLFGENLILGIHAQAGRIDIDPEDASYDGGITSVGGLFRMTIVGSLWYADFSLGAARNRNEASFPINGGRAAAKKNITQMNYQTELGLKAKSGFTKIEPFIGFRYINLSDGGIEMAPTDSPFLLSGSGPHSTRSLIGSRLLWEYATYIATVKPSIRGMWVHEYGDKSVFMTSDTLLFPIAGEFGNRTFPRDRAVLGVGVSAALRDMVDLYFDYSSAFASEAVTYSIMGGLNVKY